uniref:exodeoxyribonuclease III n=1 Tax=Amphiprion ocellaris TaxID=80972 RepID=A0AAQ5X3B6_AMPOC
MYFMLIQHQQWVLVHLHHRTKLPLMEQVNIQNMSDIKITSWNVRGLRRLIKLKQVINRIKQLKSKIIFLQETHLTMSDVKLVKNRWPGQVVHASYNNYARGVLILIHRTVPFQMIKTIQDPAGRYVIAQGNILSFAVNLVSIYGPNENNPKFFEDLFLTISTLQGSYIIGGDFNCTLNPTIDHSTGSDIYKTQTRQVINQYISDINLVEVWRE